MRFLFALGALLLTALWPALARAQPARPLPSFYTTYRYTGYTVYDSSTELPTPVGGVGGSLTLRPAGTYEKRLSITGPNGPRYFRQDGTYILTGDSIRFAFTDAKGADVQRGTFTFNPATRRLSIIILGYPTSNRGVYELVAAEASRPAAGPRKKARR